MYTTTTTRANDGNSSLLATTQQSVITTTAMPSCTRNAREDERRAFAAERNEFLQSEQPLTSNANILRALASLSLATYR